MIRRAAWLVVPIGLAALLAFASLASRAPDAATAFTLKPGDCFDIPADDRIGDIATMRCDSPHDAEVFVAADESVAALAAASAAVPAPAPAYPGAEAFGEWVSANCGSAAVLAYRGPDIDRPLAVGYFFPSADAWARGERRVTCYLHAAGEKLTAPLARDGTPPARSQQN